MHAEVPWLKVPRKPSEGCLPKFFLSRWRLDVKTIKEAASINPKRSIETGQRLNLLKILAIG